MKCKNNTKKTAFTLVELLVVISIISMLIAILLPALSAARDAARAIQCMSNQRQLAIASLSYANDHEQYLPFAPSGERSIQYLLVQDDYIQWGVASCPSLPLVKPTGAWYQAREKAYQGYGVLSSGWSGLKWIDGVLNTSFRVKSSRTKLLTRVFGHNWTANYALSLRHVRQAGMATKFPLFVDSAATTGNGVPAGVATQFCQWSLSTTTYTNGLQLRHSGAANMVFVDGHASAMSKQALHGWRQATEIPLDSVYDENMNTVSVWP